MDFWSLYAPLATALAFDLRVRGLSWAERGVLHHLYLLAAMAPDRATVPLPGRAGEAAHATWKRALGDDGAASVAVLVAAGLLEVVPEGLRATLQTALVAPPIHAEGKAPSPAPDAPRGASARPPPTDPVHALRETFRRHRLRTAEERRAWLATEHGQRAVERMQLTPEAVEAVVSKTGTNGGRFGVRDGGHATAVTAVTHGSHDGNHASHATAVTTAITSLPPHTPPSEKETREQSVSARETAVTHGSHDGNHASHATAVTITPRQSRVGDHAPSTDPLVALQTRSASVADLVGGGDMEGAAGAFLVRCAVTVSEVEAMARALATPSAWWPTPNPPRRATLAALAGLWSGDGHEWKALAALVAHVRAQAAQAAPLSAPPPVRPPKPAVLAPEKSAALRAAIEAARAQEPA